MNRSNLDGEILIVCLDENRRTRTHQAEPRMATQPRAPKTGVPLRNVAATIMLVLIAGTVALVGSSAATKAAAPTSLEIYFIDVEGGQSTLMVTPDRQSLLIDA